MKFHSESFGAINICNYSLSTGSQNCDYTLYCTRTTLEAPQTAYIILGSMNLENIWVIVSDILNDAKESHRFSYGIPVELNRKNLSHSALKRATSKLEKAMAPHSSTLAWKIPWTEEPGRLRSMGS